MNNIEIYRFLVTINVMKLIGTMILALDYSSFGGFEYTFLAYYNTMPGITFT
jgi:hypothetical protein